jgi:hypothetical protein
MSFLKNHNIAANKTVITTLTHLIIIEMSYWLIHKYFNAFVLPNNRNLLNYDASWYYTIKKSGYIYAPGASGNLAFFPLFPLVWRLTNLSPFCLSFFNSVIFFGSFVFLTIKEKLSAPILLFILAFPSAIFFLLPYSESIFYLFCVLIIIGYQRKNCLLFIGLFGASLTRSTCVIFMPAILIITLLTYGYDIQGRKKMLTALLYQTLATLGGFMVASAYMAWDTGKWFYFIEVQKYWGRQWIIPSFPFTTISPARVLGLDAVTVVIGIISIYICIKWIFLNLKQRLYPKKTRHINFDPHVLFSALYLAGNTIIDTCFTFNSDLKTNIWSINRHIMCTPFAAVFIIYLYNQFRPQLKEKIFFIALIAGGLFYTEIYKYPQLTLFFVFFFAMLLVLKYARFITNIFWLYYIFSIFIQLGFYSDFLSNLWIG